ncbi:ferredoxin-type protein NapF, partial [Salmonella enterica subsp. enterica serovar Typhimurium]
MVFTPYGSVSLWKGDIMVDLSRRSMLTGSWRNASNGILPPWARETTYFLAHCLRCDACIQACEADIL